MIFAAGDKVCALDGHSLVEIGRETSEQLDIIPAQVKVIRHVRIKYACPHCRQGVNLAPMPSQPIPKSLASAGMLAFLAASKYADGLPLYRMESVLQRSGIELDRTVMAHWMIKAGHLVQPLINLLRDRMLDYGIIQMDETRVQVLKEPGRPATSQSFMWVQRGGPPGGRVILFDYDPSRSGQVPLNLLTGYEGWLQTDGYSDYSAVGTSSRIESIGCWSHVRRKFDEAVKAAGKGKKPKAAETLGLIKKLYAIENVATSWNRTNGHGFGNRKRRPSSRN
ncbi:MAG: IS66 family transposase, partial [Magnetococcales bacterium]|nr:IS66 family transposase [Magnetococcales bacterium]